VSLEFSWAAEAGYVRIQVSGDFSLEAILPLCDRFFEVTASAGREAMLVDARSVTGREPTMAERYQWAVRVAAAQALHQPRIRVALLGHEPLIHPERFGEIVVTNRGGLIRTFTEEPSALEWLLGKARGS
jgi:hypothetical protein